MAQQTVIGVFDDASDAQRAVDQLVSNGFSRDSIDLSAQTSPNYSDSTATRIDRDDDDDNNSGIGGFFSSLFGSDSDDSRKYSHVASRGSVVTVHAQSSDEAERAADLLDEYGAVDVDERANEYGYASYNQTSNAPNSVDYNAASTGAPTTGIGATGTGYGVTDDLTNTSDRIPTADTNTDQTIKVIEENLEVGKREVERGGVRVRSRIIERPVEESLRLREERVHVQRTPVNRPATADDLNAFQEGSIELIEHAEVPVVSKTANVVEEISVGKEVNERVETIRDTVRSTDVDVENLTSTDPLTQTNQTNRAIDLDDDANTAYTNR
ncbi:hypothetical protein GCM10028819_29110 [Spirosoma humi]